MIDPHSIEGYIVVLIVVAVVVAIIIPAIIKPRRSHERALDAPYERELAERIELERIAKRARDQRDAELAHVAYKRAERDLAKRDRERDDDA